MLEQAALLLEIEILEEKQAALWFAIFGNRV